MSELAQGVVDAYAHAGAPRFPSAANQLNLMAAAGVERLVLVLFDSSPDLHDAHQALRRDPDRVRVVGVPLGRDDDELAAGVRAQLAAGFSGIRLSGDDLTSRPWLLDEVAAGPAGGVAMAATRCADPAMATVLLDALHRHPGLQVLGCHFAGSGTPTELQSRPASELFGHPRFGVILSRHGGYRAPELIAWASALLEVVGWDRVLWGSESPLLFWRDESVPDALAWVDHLAPTPDQRRRYLSDNATRLFFDRPAAPAALTLPFDPRDRARPVPAQLFGNGVRVDQALAGRLVQDWRRSAPEKSLGEHLGSLLDRSLPALEME